MTRSTVSNGHGYIGNIAKASGVPIKTIRYYEEVGLLPEPERTESGYRVYSEAVVERLTFVKKAQHLGLSLSEIQDILDLSDRKRCPCGHVQKLLQRQVQDIHQRIQDLKVIEGRIHRVLRTPCPPQACHPQGKAQCPYIEKVSLEFKGKKKGTNQEVRKSWTRNRK